MVKRRRFPFIGLWVLPGGHVEYGERVEEAIKREMKDYNPPTPSSHSLREWAPELGVSVKIKKLFGVYSNPKRDPRYHTVSLVYLLEKGKGKIRLNKESSEFKYFPLKNLPKKIGFDHREILNDLKKNGNRSKIGDMTKK